MSLLPGIPAPHFFAPAPNNPRFAFSSLGGRYVLLAFLPGPGADRDAALALIKNHARSFDDERLAFFGVLPDAASFAAATTNPPFRWFWDEVGELRQRFHATTPEGDLLPQWVLIDPTLRIMGTGLLLPGADFVAKVASLGRPEDHAGVKVTAPILVVPRVLEQELCTRLINHYEVDGGAPSGVMRQIDGRTVGVLNDFKKRRDTMISDPELVALVRSRLASRLLPEIARAFQFKATRIERFIVACYEAEDGGHFKPHRDNTTSGTAHRKFAVSINLNSDFDGGNLRFPEYGPSTHRPPLGGAVVFSCSLLHEATEVTRGTRYATLPFLYDEEGAAVREANLSSLQLHPTAEPNQEAAQPPLAVRDA